jgi:Secretion system C-terminal sorting domain
VYNPATNTVQGTRIFVIKKRDGSFAKFQIENLVVNDYKFRIANLDGSNEVEAVITKDKGVSGKLLYFSFDSGKVSMPTDYDLVFQRYRTPVPVGDGSFLDYNVTGVLLAPGVEAVVVDGVDPLTVTEATYADKYSKNISTIGYEWKSFDLNAGWSMDVDRTQFVKARNGNKYQITFYDYEGSSTGVTTLGRKFISGNAVINALQNDIHVYPNPTADMITVDGLKDNAQVVVSDNAGRVVLKSGLTQDNNTVSLRQLPLGMYSVKIETAKGTAVKQVVKK